jgi:hypothetical protein
MASAVLESVEAPDGDVDEDVRRGGSEGMEKATEGVVPASGCWWWRWRELWWCCWSR